MDALDRPSEVREELTRYELFDWMNEPIPESGPIQAHELPAVRSAFQQGYLRARKDILKMLAQVND